jgi:hypothetical protein
VYHQLEKLCRQAQVTVIHTGEETKVGVLVIEIAYLDIDMLLVLQECTVHTQACRLCGKTRA